MSPEDAPVNSNTSRDGAERTPDDPLSADALSAVGRQRLHARPPVCEAGAP
jgi:hypothetical protein